MQITVIDEKHPYYAIVQKMQAYWGCMVYHVVESGNLLYLLNVHNDKDCWNYCWPENDRMMVLYCNLDDTDDDLVFYCMNSYWEPLTLQLPSLTNGMEWRVKVNTNCEYLDGADFDYMTEKFGPNTIRVPARTTIIFVAE